MRNLLAFLKRNALVESMLLGAIGYPIFAEWRPFLPPLIFLMLFFTFCKVNPLDLRLHVWHWLVLVVQIALAVLVYYGMHYGLIWFGLWSEEREALTQGAMICFLMPTATAGPIIAGKLGGSIQNLTTFTLLSNFATALIVPAFFPLVNPEAGLSFWQASSLILAKVGPLLLGPFFAAWALRLIYNAVQRYKKSEKTFALSPSVAQLPFWLWAGTLVVLMGDLTNTLVHASYSWWTVVWLCLAALISCLLQFWLGWKIGWHFPATSHGVDYQDIVINPAAAPTTPAGISRITAGQAFGQKNTTLAVWMAQTYLLPLSALGPAIYIIVQNVFNNFQLARAAKVTTVRPPQG